MASRPWLCLAGKSHGKNSDIFRSHSPTWLTAKLLLCHQWGGDSCGYSTSGHIPPHSSIRTLHICGLVLKFTSVTRGEETAVDIPPLATYLHTPHIRTLHIWRFSTRARIDCYGIGVFFFCSEAYEFVYLFSQLL